MNYPNAIRFDGLDHRGKDTLATEVAKRLSLFRPVTKLSYPMYFAFGYNVRLMNRGAGKDFLSTKSPGEQFEIRKSMYALDRALSLPAIKRQKILEPDTILISDRCETSNLITAAFLASLNRIPFEELRSFIANGWHFAEAEFSKTTAGHTFICTNQIDISRAADDDLERAIQQTKHLENMSMSEIADMLYEQLPTLGYPEDTIHMIHTAVGNKWRHLDELVDEVLTQCGITTPVDTNSQFGVTAIGPGKWLTGLFDIDLLTEQDLTFINDIQSNWQQVVSEPSSNEKKARLEALENRQAVTVNLWIRDHLSALRKFDRDTVHSVVRLYYGDVKQLTKETDKAISETPTYEPVGAMGQLVDAIYNQIREL